MPKNIKLGVELRADTKGFVGEIRVSEKALDKFAGRAAHAARNVRGMGQSV